MLLIISKADDAIENAIDESKIKPLYEINLEKYVNYSTDSESGTVVQMNLKTGIEYGEGIEYSPLSSMGVSLNLPKIEGEYPISVELIGKCTKATNGSETGKDIENNYNTETGLLQIVAVNREDENGNIYRENVNGARDEYTVILYYGSNCYTDANVQRNIDVSGYVQANIANEEGTSKKVDIDNKNKVTENISGLISTSVRTSDIYNGYISANSQNGTSYRTEYKENVDVNISKKEIADEIIVSMNNSLINKREETVETDAIIYKSTRIDKNKILDILGQDGYLRVQNENGDVLGELNKDTEVNENGIYEITYQNEVNKIIVKTSKPVKVGTIQIENTREIKETVTDVNINRIQTNAVISCINNIQETVIETVKEIDEETNEEKDVEKEVVKESTKEIYKYEDKNVIEIKDAETRIDMSISNTNWTNNVQNDITFNATLVANSARYNLFKNPVIEIKLPQEVEKVILGEASLVYGEGLTKKEPEVIEKDGCKVIRMQIEGSQVEYFINSMVDGVNVIIPATIIVRKDIGNTETNVNLTYANGNGTKNDYIKEGKENKNIRINIVSYLNKANQLMATTSLDNEDAKLAMKVTSILGDKELQDGDIVHEQEYIKYRINLKNNTNDVLNNINVVGKVPEGTTYIEHYYVTQITDEESMNGDSDLLKSKEDSSKTEYNEVIKLEASEEKELYYWVKVNDLQSGEEDKEISNNIKVYQNSQEKLNYQMKNIVNKAEMKINIKAWETTREDNLWSYNLEVTNNTNNDIQNPVVNLILPEELTYKYVIEGADYTANETNAGVEVKLDKLLANQSKKITLFIQFYGKDDTKAVYEVSTVANVKGEETETYYSDINIQKMYNMTFEIIQTSEKEGKELAYNEEIEYVFTIRNTSNNNIKRQNIGVNLLDFIDSNLVAESAEYQNYVYDEEKATFTKLDRTIDLSSKTIPDGVEDSNLVADANILLTIPTGEEVVVKIKARASVVSDKTEIANYGQIVYDYCGAHTKNSNIIKNTILSYDYGDDEEPGDLEEPGVPGEPDDPNTPDDPEDPNNPSRPGDPDFPSDERYSISGIAWIDKNKDGQINESEQKYQNLTVKLFNAKTNSIVKNKDGNNYVVTTDKSGKYKFTDVPIGEYLVVFEYDNNNYALTTYKKSNINEQLNSNVIEKTASIDGSEKTIGITDILELNDSDIEFINIGLVLREKFDLSLNKTITSVSTTYAGKTKQYDYKDSKLAKVDIPAKNISGAKILVEYQIEIKNEGDIDGYVEEIIDYLPEGFDFNVRMNDGWSKSSNGTLKYIGLAGQTIKTGESKYIKLYLTKTLSGNSVGRITNEAEILKSSNKQGIADTDSVSGNKKEDDYSEAVLIISIKTGALLYASIIILILVALITLKILIDKKVINIKGIKHFCAIMIFTGIIATTLSTYAFSKTDAEGYLNARMPLSGSASCSYTPEPYQTFGYIGHNGAAAEGHLHCTDGAAMAVSPAAWTYTPTSRVWNIGDISSQLVRGPEAKIKDKYEGQNKAKFWPYGEGENEEYYIVGPFKVDYKGTITKFDVYKKNRDTGRESKINSDDYVLIKEDKKTRLSGMPESNKDFYIRVKKNVTWIPKIYIEVYSRVIRKYSFFAGWTEYWTTGAAGAQVLEKPGKIPNYTTDDIPEDTRDHVTLGGVKLSVGHLKIRKADTDTGATLDGWKVTVENKFYHYKKNFTISADKLDRNGYYVIKNLPTREYTSNSSNPKLDYEITEIKTPSGYNLDLQDENQVKRTKQLSSTTEITVKNKQYGDINLIKVDQGTFDPLSGVGFVIFKKNGETYHYLKTYRYKDKEKAIIEWTTNISEAKLFYSGVQGEIDAEGYINGNCTNELGAVSLKNLPVRESDGTSIIYSAQEFRFDYTVNPELIYYKLDKTKIEASVLITNAYNKHSTKEHKIALLQRVTEQFYTSDYARKMTKDKDAGDVITGIYKTIMNSNPKASFVNQYKNTFNSNKKEEGYDSTVISNMIKAIFSDTNNKSTLESRVDTIFSDENNIIAYRDSLFANVGIQGEDIAETMQRFAYYGLKSQTAMIMKNKQYAVDISGYVWDDIAMGKNTERNNLYKDGLNDINDFEAPDVDVRLYAERSVPEATPTLQMLTDGDGNYKFKGVEFVFDENGNPVYEEDDGVLPRAQKVQFNILVDNLDKYFISFEYNGMKYQNVLTEKEMFGANQEEYVYTRENSSKARENDTERANFNTAFSYITGRDRSQDMKVTTGVSVNNGATLTYDSSKDYVSTMWRKMTEEEKAKRKAIDCNIKSAEGKIDPYTSISMKARTNETGAQCNFKYMYVDGMKEITGVNLGLYEREQPDLAIATDIDNIQLNINGYAHTYRYGRRNPFIKNGYPDNDINNGYSAILDGFSVGVKNGIEGASQEYKNCTYTREIYDSYLAYTKANEESDNRLRVFVTYKIAVKNESTKLYQKVTLKNYSDPRFNRIEESYYNNSNGEKVPVNWTGKDGVWQTEQINNCIVPSECINVYLKYELNTKTIVDLAHLKDIEINDNITEIVAYSTYSDANGTIGYGGIDKDSAPNNMVQATRTTYEDDTDIAPGLKFSRKASKEISGLVFEDGTSNELQTGKVREGDKQYKNGEKTVENVEVKLLNYSDDVNNRKAITLYDLNDGGEVVTKAAQDLTASDGKYNFKGLIPGEYYIQYTYGDFKYKDLNKEGAQDEDKTSKIDGKEVTTQDYKSTIVDSNTFKTLIDNNIENTNGRTNLKNSGMIHDNRTSQSKDTDLWYWYEKGNNANLSSAVDDKQKRNDINSTLKTINYGVKTDYENKTNKDLHRMDAYTGIMDVAIEDYRDQITKQDGTEGDYVEGSRNYQIKFGIVERPRQSLQVNKEINGVAVTLANGQVLVHGDPRKDEIKYVTYPEFGPAKIEIDNEIVEGATLDLDYIIRIDNRSELDYDNLEYYRYGNVNGAQPVKIKLDAIVDYLDEKLNITYDIEDSNSKFEYYDNLDTNATTETKWKLFTGTLPNEGDNVNKLAGINIDPNIFAKIQSRGNIVVKNPGKELAPIESTTLELKAKKLLTDLSNNDQIFDNFVELLQVTNEVGRFYGEMIVNNRNKEWKLATPGNFDVSNASESNECDDSNYGRYSKYITDTSFTDTPTSGEIYKPRDAKLVIIPPTGGKTILVYGLIGLGCLIVLSGGIVLIKKFVLN